MPATTSSAEERLYDLLEKRRVDRSHGLPNSGQLDEAVSALSAVQEFFTDPIAAAVARVANSYEPHSFTHEDVGRLIFYADHVREVADTIRDDAAKVACIAHHVFSQVAGFDGDPERSGEDQSWPSVTLHVA